MGHFPCSGHKGHFPCSGHTGHFPCSGHTGHFTQTIGGKEGLLCLSLQAWSLRMGKTGQQEWEADGSHVGCALTWKNKSPGKEEVKQWERNWKTWKRKQLAYTVYSDAFFFLDAALKIENLGNYGITVFLCNYVHSLSAQRPLSFPICLLGDEMT